MKWKKFPSWLKGGVIGAGIFIVMFLLSYAILMLGCMESALSLISQRSEIMFPTPCLLVYLFFATWFIALPFFTIVGALIGIIIEKKSI
jgi:hypothetical protein